MSYLKPSVCSVAFLCRGIHHHTGHHKKIQLFSVRTGKLESEAHKGVVVVERAGCRGQLIPSSRGAASVQASIRVSWITAWVFLHICPFTVVVSCLFLHLLIFYIYNLASPPSETVLTACECATAPPCGSQSNHSSSTDWLIHFHQDG